MATEEEVMKIIEKYKETCPDKFWQHKDTTNAGLGAVLRCLMKHEGQATAGQIKEDINVSTARVAVLTKKMQERGWVIRFKSPSDARVTMVKLTDEGMELGLSIRRNIRQEIEKLIDEIGAEKLIEFIEMRERIFNLVDHSKFCIH